MPKCEGCGRQVTEQFARVFGDNDGIVHACSKCEKHTNLFSGAGAGQ